MNCRQQSQNKLKAKMPVQKFVEEICTHLSPLCIHCKEVIFMAAGQVIIVILAVIGLCSLMQWLMHVLYRSGNKSGTFVLVLHFSGHREDAEYELRCAKNRLRDEEDYKRKELLIVDDGMDDETKRTCLLFFRKKPGVSMCSGEAFANIKELLYTEFQ
jgi:hypothetical protein